MESMVITFCGHGFIVNPTQVKKELITVLCEIITRANNCKITFLCGGYGHFDALAASAVDDVKSVFSSCVIEKIFVTPYITESYDRRNKFMGQFYDEVVYPPLENVPYRYAIAKRNEWMIENSHLVIAYVIHAHGGAASALRYAYRKRKRVIRLTVGCE